MKKPSFISLALSLLLVQGLFQSAHAGGSWSCRNSCWGSPKWKYKANAHVQQKEGAFWRTKTSSESKNCNDATATANFGSAYGLAWARPGSHDVKSGSNLSYQRGGPGFSGSTSSDIVSGYAYSHMGTVLTIDESNLVRLSNITGELTAGADAFGAADGFGAAWTVAVWLAPTPDELIDTNKVLVSGSAWIENGTLHTTGIFTAADFTATMSVATNGQTGEVLPVTRYVPVAGLVKNIQLPPAVVADHIVVSAFGESGYGAYDEAAVLTGEPFVLVNIPTLSEWGMIILSLLLLTVGTVFILRRRVGAPALAGTPA